MTKVEMFYLKMLGSVLIFVSGTSIGYLFSRDLSKRYIDLQALLHYFTIIKSDIAYGGVSLSEVFHHVETSCKPHHREWVAYLNEQSRGNESTSFQQIWESGIQEYRNQIHLSKEEWQELVEIGTSIGEIDKEQQILMLGLYIKKLEYRIQELNEEKKAKKKLYQLFGVAGSLLIIVILL